MKIMHHTTLQSVGNLSEMYILGFAKTEGAYQRAGGAGVRLRACVTCFLLRNVSRVLVKRSSGTVEAPGSWPFMG